MWDTASEETRWRVWPSSRHACFVEEVRRPDDGELCGHVELRNGSWFALVVFGAVLGCHTTRDDAFDQVLSDGFASLAERWTLQRDKDASVRCRMTACGEAR